MGVKIISASTSLGVEEIKSFTFFSSFQTYSTDSEEILAQTQQQSSVLHLHFNSLLDPCASPSPDDDDQHRCPHSRSTPFFAFKLHEAAFALLHPRVVLLVRGVDQRVGLLVLLDVLLHAEMKKIKHY